MTSKDNLNPEPTQLDNVSGKLSDLLKTVFARPEGNFKVRLDRYGRWQLDKVKFNNSSVIYFDEASDWTPEMQELLETLSNKYASGGDNLPMSDLTNKEN